MNKKALVIGGGGTLGRSFVSSLIKRDFEVSSTYFKNKNPQCSNFYLNLDSDSNSIVSSLNKIQEEFSTPDLLIIASGTAFYNPLPASSQDDINHTLKVDLLGPIEIVKFFLPFFLKRNTGTIHIVSAIAGVLPAVKNMSIYTSAKFGLVGFVRSLAWELLGTSVKISVSCPGGIKSDLPNNALGDKESLVKFFESFAKNFDDADTISEAILDKLNSREIILFPTDSAKKLFEQNLQKPFWA